MKKVLLVSALVMTIVASMVSGTLAVYNVGVATIATGPVVAKEFILTGEGEASFTTGVLIAPTEIVTMDFSVSNISSEVPIDVTIAVDFAAIGVDNEIKPLIAVLKDGATVVATNSLTNGVGTLTFDKLFDVTQDPDTNAYAGETKTYTVEITWQSEADSSLFDNDYLGNGFGTTLTVSVEGTQHT